MQTLRKSTDKLKAKEKASKDDNLVSSRKTTEEKVKKTINNVSTPRNYVQKASMAEIYSQKKVASSKAPKKVSSTTSRSTVSPMKEYLKESPSVSQSSLRSSVKSKPDSKNLERKVSSSLIKTESNSKKISRTDSKSLVTSVKKSAGTPRTAKDLPFVNVTVNSPVSKKKIDLNKSFEIDTTPKSSKYPTKDKQTKSTNNTKTDLKGLDRGDSKDIDINRQRSKTRTLDEAEIKVLTADTVDNNAEMKKLTKKLAAQPKAFYIDLQDEKSKDQKQSDEEISYEDDFESYESDFESYHSEASNTGKSSNDLDYEDNDDVENGEENESEKIDNDFKDVKDDEKMLDSGNFELRESQRSASKKARTMDFIVEDTEGEDKKISLTDEGFQEMSNSSAVSSMKTIHVDVLDRPLLVDFSKSRESKRKRIINERLKQRAKDILSMITLHEMSYSLFEMKPIPYDLYMATFGRSNYTQVASQTFDDGITQQIQTDEILSDEKWTQYPVKFSKHDICLTKDDNKRKLNDEDYLSKFTFLVNQNLSVNEEESKIDEEYKNNPLRIYFEQKNGVGTNKILPYEHYKSKLKSVDYNVAKLNKFLNKYDSTVNQILSFNAGDSNQNELKSSTLSFSKGYITIANKNLSEDLLFMKNSIIENVVFSETKSNLIMIVHNSKTSKKIDMKRYYISLWDINKAKNEPEKILIAISDIEKACFRGNANGLFVAALDDGSLHLWDLEEEPIWRNDINEKSRSELVECNSKALTQVEKDREWNLKNSAVGFEDQVISLQRSGVLNIWLIIQEKTQHNQELGKAFWSKIKLEKNQSINFLDYHFNTMDVDNGSTSGIDNGYSNFSLNAAKRRLSFRKSSKTKKANSRPKSAVSFDFDIDRPSSATSVKSKNLVVSHQNWESGVICNDLKVVNTDRKDCFLVAKNWGEVLTCTRIVGTVKIEKFCVASDRSSITCIEVSPHTSTYYLAATESGTIHLCSLPDSKVLLTLDCRNGPASNELLDKCESDHKGRFVSTGVVRPTTASYDDSLASNSKLSISSLVWSKTNPCSIFTLSRDGALRVFELTHSDIYAKFVNDKAAVACTAAESNLALLTPDNEVQVHRLASDHTASYVELFNKYASLL